MKIQTLFFTSLFMVTMSAYGVFPSNTPMEENFFYGVEIFKTRNSENRALLEDITELVRQGHNSKNEDGITTLMLAAQLSAHDPVAVMFRLQIVKSLLKWGEDPNVATVNQETPLWFIVLGTMAPDIFELLLFSGANAFIGIFEWLTMERYLEREMRLLEAQGNLDYVDYRRLLKILKRYYPETKLRRCFAGSFSTRSS